MKDSMKSKIICIFLLFIITSLLFQYTVGIREPWMGKINEENNQWLTGSTLKFSTNWYVENPLNLKFTMLENPKSIEFSTLSSRVLYTSYPPGTVIPIYILSKIVGHKPTLTLIMKYNLFNQFLIAFLLSLIVFFTFLQLKLDIRSAFIFSIIPILLELTLPGPLYWHQNVFFSDQAIILPFVSFIFLEIIRTNYAKNKRALTTLSIIQAIIMFYGILTDWLFVFIALTVYIKRIFSKEMFREINIREFLTKSIIYWFPGIISITLFIIQIYSLNYINSTIEKGLFRTGISPEGSSEITNFIGQMQIKFFNDYGSLITYIFFISLIICLIISILITIKYLKDRKIEDNIKKILKILYTTGLLAIPCFLQILIFKNHSFVHPFSVLKFSVPIAIIPFVFTPLILYLILKDLKFNKINLKLPNINYLFILSLLSLVLVSGILIYEHYPNTNYFPKINNSDAILGHSIHKNTKYNDIVFSPDLEVPMNPPQVLSYSMKRVYKINSPEEIKEMLNNMSTKGKYTVVILFKDKPMNWPILNSATSIKKGQYYYYYIDPKYLMS